MRKLLYRWFVEYNPMYVASAALVLIGVTLLQRGSSYASAAIAEVYSWALIGGAALLMHLALRRPAVMLALLAVIYQGDITLHTETAAYLGWTGVATTAIWLASFAGKLFALARALRLRVSASAIGVPLLGALGLVTIPRFYPLLDEPERAKLLALWLFTLFAAALWTTRRVRSAVPLDAWGETVLARALRATWLIWGLLALAHAEFWSTETDLRAEVLLPVAALLATRGVRGEASIWAIVCITLFGVAVAAPSSFAVTAAMSAVALCLRALREPKHLEPEPRAPAPSAPYRTPSADAPPPRPVAPAVVFGLASRAAQARLAAGALTSVYLAAWTTTWSGGAWPAHVAALDAALVSALAFLFWRFRARIAALPVVATTFHWAVQTGLVTAPDTRLEWAISSVSVGFGLLLASLFASVRLRPQRSADASSELHEIMQQRAPSPQ